MLEGQNVNPANLWLSGGGDANAFDTRAAHAVCVEEQLGMDDPAVPTKIIYRDSVCYLRAVQFASQKCLMGRNIWMLGALFSSQKHEVMAPEMSHCCRPPSRNVWFHLQPHCLQHLPAYVQQQPRPAAAVEVQDADF